MSVLFVYTVEDDNSSSRDSITLSFGAVTQGYFVALATRVAAGRRFDAADIRAEVAPVMLSETAARFVYSNEDPIAARCRTASRFWSSHAANRRSSLSSTT